MNKRSTMIVLLGALGASATGLMLIAGLAGLLVGSGASFADGGDYQQARQLRESGAVLPLETVIARVREQQAGRVLEVDFEREHGRWVYEIELLAPDGSVWEFEVDAASGELLERERED